MGTVARFKVPQGVAVDTNGNVFIGDTNNHLIRKISSTGSACLAGQYFNGGSCVSVPAGFYNPTAGNGVYYSCPAGQTSLPGSGVCGSGSFCALGTYSSTGTDSPSACSLCPVGSFCPSTGCTFCAVCNSAYFIGAANCNYGKEDSF